MNKSSGIIFVLVILAGCLMKSSNQLVQMDIRQLKEEYPELMDFLYSTPSSDMTNESTESSESSTSDPPTSTFIYYNSSTHMLEGISMQSTYSIFKLNPYKIFTLITTTSLPLYTPNSLTPNRKILSHSSPSLIPLYHQFIYSIDIFNYLPSKQKVRKDLAGLLNEQTIESSQLRVHILKAISSQLALSTISLRINWIEQLNRKEGDLTEKILISLSSVSLLDLQNEYSQAIKEKNKNRANELSKEYEYNCHEYFKLLSLVHRQNEFGFEINFLELVYPNETFFKNDRNNNNNYERVEKVQLLKLCNLKSIYSILSLSDKATQVNSNLNRLLPKQLKLANNLIKRSTEEIEFELDDTLGQMNSTDSYEDEENIETVTVVNYSGTNTTLDNVIVEIANNGTTDRIGKYLLWMAELREKAVKCFWSIVPEEDFLLAVVVPAIVIVSLIVFTIVSICILQMCNRDYRESKEQIGSLSNTTDLSMAPPTTLKKGVSTSLKERAYLSKGVPVILYEEMSDKPIDDYDENHREVMDNGCENTRNYRSPLIMRNEKPPMPAPPEYSRANNEYSHVIVNELSEETSMLIATKGRRAANGNSSGRSSFYKPLDSINESSFK